jgi:catechol 2,3-dioxygenase-like lactoylglutathione lyase family enzyme
MSAHPDDLRRTRNGGTIAVMTPPGRLVAFAATRDLDRAERFYGGVLGLDILTKNPHAIAFDNEGTELRLTLVATKAQAPYTVLGWSVDDLTARVAELRDRGVSFTRYPGMEQDADDAWTAPDGTRVAWFTDPDGSVLSLHETA